MFSTYSQWMSSPTLVLRRLLCPNNGWPKTTPLALQEFSELRNWLFDRSYLHLNVRRLSILPVIRAPYPSQYCESNVELRSQQLRRLQHPKYL